MNDSTEKESRPIYICIKPSFFANRLFNVGQQCRSKKNPGANWRLFDPAVDKPTESVASNPHDFFLG